VNYWEYVFTFKLMDATLDNGCYTMAVHGFMGRQVNYYEKTSQVSKSHLPRLPSYPWVHSSHTFQYHQLLDVVT